MSRIKVIAVRAAAAALATATPILAAEGGHGADAPNPFTGNLGNAIWTLLIFLIVLIVLGKAAWKPMLTALQNREKFIRESLEAARRDREESERKLRAYEERLAKAREEASAIVEEGRRDAENVKRRIEEEARKNADALIERARREIGIARDSALKELYEQSAQMALTLAGSVLKRQLAPEDQQRLIAEALGELQGVGHGGGKGPIPQ
ncbi:MAG: F0F1 ATP synthase subunit B [Phycisphaerae bacterium]|jgi:F-type H+-transporting ATPase subunit b